MRPPASPHIRRYVPSDLTSLHEIDEACFARGIAYSMASLRWFLSLPGAMCRVSEMEGKLVGFAIAHAESDEGHWITLDVLAPYRRRRIGSLLLDALETDLAAQGVRAIGLETATNNQAAIAFWRKHGYRTLGILERYYLGRIDAYFMTKPLPAQRET